MRLDSALKKSRPQYISALKKSRPQYISALKKSRPQYISALKKSRPQYISAQKILLLMKLPDNFQMREYLRPCRFHIMRA